MTIPLGTIVRDKVTGFVGVAENRATFLYGCDRYFIQPQIKEDGSIPDGAMIDEPQLEPVEDKEPVMEAMGDPEQLVELGQVVKDPVKDVEGTVTGRAVYLNGCSRVFVEPKFSAKTKELASYWVDEQQVEPLRKRTKVVEKTEGKAPGGPARSSSKY